MILRFDFHRDIPLNHHIYHYNVDDYGRVWMDILKDNWSPALTIESVLLSVQSLLSDPNGNEGDQNRCKSFQTNHKEYTAHAYELTLLHAFDHSSL